MKYMGSKARIVKEILPIMLDDEHDTFVDCFMGSGAVIGNVSNKYRRIANDKNKYLVAMFKSLVDGKEFPESIPRELYNDVRDCWHGKNDRYQDDMVGWVGFMASFNGRFSMAVTLGIMWSARTESQGTTSRSRFPILGRS